MRIPFNKTHISGKALEYIREIIATGSLAGGQKFTRLCEQWFEERYGAHRVMLTHSGSHALELATLLTSIGPGDEVIMPSFTFVTTAQSVVLRGGTPVFVDIREDDLNIDAERIESAITAQTKAILPVHYAGVPCKMPMISAIAQEHKLIIIEDAAHAILSTHEGIALGSEGHFGCISFHETKNLSAGEGGVLLINDPSYIERAEKIYEKGTDRRQFRRGRVDKYTWQDIGSSFPPSEIVAALIWSQLEMAEEITANRLAIWEAYQASLNDLASQYEIQMPQEPYNAHMFYCIFSEGKHRERFIRRLHEAGISSVFHYVPLHSSPGGRKYGRVAGQMTVTDRVSDRLTRLPLWYGLEKDLPFVIDSVREAIVYAHS